MWPSLLEMFFCISNFLEQISILSHSIVFFYLFALTTEEDFLNSPCYFLEFCIQMGISSFSPFSFTSLLFTVIFKASSHNHFAFLHFFLGWFWSMPPVQNYEPPFIVLQALCLSDLISWTYLSLPLIWFRSGEKSWAPKNWWFWTVVLEKTLESPLDCKEIQPVHSEGDRSWVFTGRTDFEA